MLVKRQDCPIFSAQWSHGIRIMFQHFSSNIIWSKPERSTFYHGLQTFEETPTHTSLAEVSAFVLISLHALYGKLSLSQPFQVPE